MTDSERLEEALAAQPVVARLLERLPDLDLPDWYVGAGCIAQTVWNRAHGFDATFGIKDYDIVYFDGTDLSVEAERDVERRIDDTIDADRAVALDVTNEARVHLWYEQRFGKRIDPYTSSCDAIATWPTTATSVGVRRTAAGRQLEVCAPFGLDDLFGLIVRPNKKQVPRDVYEAKAARWLTAWPRLQVMPW